MTPVAPRLLVLFLLVVPAAPLHAQVAAPPLTNAAEMRLRQAATDEAWRRASVGYMRMEKITYRSRADNLEIPAFVFQPLADGGSRHPALVWTHEDIRGHLYEHYIPYIREATARGYVVIAPEYRGSIGYGREFFDAIDYGGAEVDDVASAVEVLKLRYPDVDPARIGIIGWSHGGMIALLAIFRNPGLFHSGAALVPVTNLFQRLAWKGVERQRQLIDPHNRFGGPPSERPDVYKERSPLFWVDRLEIPLLAYVVRNDEDVNIEESMQLIDALRARKPNLAETKVYDDAPGGHMFDRQVDAWARIWRFFDRTLGMN